MKLPESFYQRPNVVKIARELLGKGLFTRVNNKVTGGMIVEPKPIHGRKEDVMLMAPVKPDVML